jgi:hypothetical protein
LFVIDIIVVVHRRERQSFGAFATRRGLAETKITRIFHERWLTRLA